MGGIKAKLRDVETRQLLASSDIILLQETFLLHDLYFPSHETWLLPAERCNEKGRPSGGLAILWPKSKGWTIKQLSPQDAKFFQVCTVTMNDETCLLVNIYVPPDFDDAFDLIYMPVLDILHSAPPTHRRIVAGDFNARIGDVESLVDNDFTHLLPQKNLDQVTNDGRAPFLSFVDLSDLRLVNGHFPPAPAPPHPAEFSFFSIREKVNKTGATTVITARSCIDYVLVDESSFHQIQSFTQVFHLNIDHSLLTIAFPVTPPPRPHLPPPTPPSWINFIHPPPRSAQPSSLTSISRLQPPTLIPSRT